MSSEVYAVSPSASPTEAPQSFLFENSHTYLRRLTQPIGVFAAACVMAATAHTGHSEANGLSDTAPSTALNSYATAGHEQAPYIPQTDSNRCNLTLAEDYIAASRLLAAPENPDIETQKAKEYRKQMEAHTLPFLPKTLSTEERAPSILLGQADKNGYAALTVVERAVRENAARKYGLTLHDPLPYITALDRDLYRDPSDKDVLGLNPRLHINDYIIAARQYLAQFGVMFDIRQPSETDPYITDEQIDTTKTREAIYALIQTFSEFPQEYINLTRVKTVSLMYNDQPTEDNQFVAGLAATGEQTIYGNLFTGVSKDIWRHEMLHHLDYVTCGGKPEATDDDPSYTSDNIGPEYVKDAPVTTYQDYVEKSNGLHEEYFNAKLRGDLEAACEKQTALQQLVENSNDITLISRYHPNATEDKAEVGISLTAHFPNPAIYDRSTPVIGRKFTKLIAKIHRFNKSLSGFFVDIKEKYGNFGPSASKLLYEDCHAPMVADSGNNGQK